MLNFVNIIDTNCLAVYQNIELEKSIPEEENYSLNYPSKLKNFTCADYYKPFLKPMLNFVNIIDTNCLAVYQTSIISELIGPIICLKSSANVRRQGRISCISKSSILNLYP